MPNISHGRFVVVLWIDCHPLSWLRHVYNQVVSLLTYVRGITDFARINQTITSKEAFLYHRTWCINCCVIRFYSRIYQTITVLFSKIAITSSTFCYINHVSQPSCNETNTLSQAFRTKSFHPSSTSSAHHTPQFVLTFNKNSSNIKSNRGEKNQDNATLTIADGENHCTIHNSGDTMSNSYDGAISKFSPDCFLKYQICGIIYRCRGFVED